MKKKILLIITLLLLHIRVLAFTYGGCDYSIVSNLKSLVTNVNISYSYRLENNNAYFDITLNNITPEMYFYDVKNKKKYYYSDTIDGEITIKNYIGNGTTGTYKFYSTRGECYGFLLGSKYYTLPKYNKYYGDKLCEGIQEYSLCQKWATVSYNYEEFEKMINKYKNKELDNEIIEENTQYEKGFFDNLIAFYVKYYHYILIGIIIIFGIVIIINKRKQKIKL